MKKAFRPKAARPNVVKLLPDEMFN